MDSNTNEITFEKLKAAVVSGSVYSLKSLVSGYDSDIEQCDDTDFTLLKTAVDNENEDIVDTLIKYGADVNNKGLLDDSLYPIHIACKKGSSRIVESLLDNGANIESRNTSYLSPLFYAVFNQHNIVVQLLVERGTDVNALIGWPIRYTVLHSAVKTANKSIVEFLVLNEADCNARRHIGGSNDAADVLKQDGSTPLSIAIKNGFTEIALLLIDKGSAVNAIVDKCTMLYYAVDNFKQDNQEIIQALIAHGADVNAKSYIDVTDKVKLMTEKLRKKVVNAFVADDRDGRARFYRDETALVRACQLGHESIVEALIDKGAHVNDTETFLPGVTPVVRALSNHRIVDILLSRGADVNTRGMTDNPLLEDSINGGHIDTTRVLLDHGAKVNTERGRSAIFCACAIGSYDAVKLLLDHGANVNEVHKNLSTPLCLAIKKECVEIVRLLVERGADVNLGRYVVRALSNHRIVDILLSRGADVNTRGPNDRPLLIDSIIGEHIDTMRVILDHGAEVNAKDERCSAIFYACISGSYAAVELLLDRGANVNETHEILGTPLLAAIYNEFVDIVRLLVERGADVNLKDPLSVAAGKGNEDMVQILVQSKLTNLSLSLLAAAVYGKSTVLKLLVQEWDKNNDTTLPHILSAAMLSNDTDTIGLMLSRSSNIYALDTLNDNRNIVFTLAENGRTDIVEQLINKGVDFNVRNIDGKTLLMIAVTKGHLETTQMLVHRGADVFAIDNDGKTAIEYAECNGHSDIARYLTNYKNTVVNTKVTTPLKRSSLFDVVCECEAIELLTKEDADIEDCNGLRPLHFAARRGLFDLAKLLVDCSATVDATDSDGNTPLHEAARQGLDITKVLVAHTKKLNVQNIKGYTPLHEAVQMKQYDVALFLIENGADINIADSWMNTPFHYTWFQDLFETSSLSSLFIEFLSKCVQPNVFGVTVLGRLKCYSSYLSESDKIRIENLTTTYNCSDVDILGNTELHRVVGVYRDSKISALCSDSGHLLKVLLKSQENNLNKRNVFGQTPLHVAQEISALKTCLEHGGEEILRTSDKCGRNVWHLLASRDDVEQIVKLIQEVVPCFETAGIESADMFGRSPLHYAATQVNGTWFRNWLLADGSKCETIQDWYGKKPLDYLCERFQLTDDVMNFCELCSKLSGNAIPFKVIEKFETSVFDRKGRRRDKTEANKVHDIFAKSRQIVSQTFLHGMLCVHIDDAWLEFLVLREDRDEAIFITNIFSNFRHDYSPNKKSLVLQPLKDTYKKDDALDRDQSEEMFKSITEIVTSFMLNLLQRVAKINQHFQGSLVPAGSSYEGTKVDSCDEFDFIVVLECFTEIVRVEESPNLPSGFCLLKMVDEKWLNTEFAEFFNAENLLNTRLVKFRFEALVKQVLYDANFQRENDCIQLIDTKKDGTKVIYSFSPDRLATNIRLKFMKPINGQRILHDVSIDVVPAISITDFWPADAVQNIDQLLVNGFKSVSKQCYLVFDQPQKKHPWVGWTSPYARVDFSILESNIIRTCPPVVRAACVVVKQIVKNFCDFKFFKSYVIKAALMHCILVDSISNKFYSDDDVQDDDHVINKNDVDFNRELALLVQKIIRRLLCFVLQDFVPSVFMPRFVLPVCSFEPHVKFSHMRLHRSGVSYDHLINSEETVRLYNEALVQSLRMLTQPGVTMFDFSRSLSPVNSHECKLDRSQEIRHMLIDSQFDHIVNAYIITHLMYWSVLPYATRRKFYFPPVNPLHETDYWPCLEEDLVTEYLLPYKFECIRLGTYRNWPKTAATEPTELAAAGLFYTGFEDVIQCPFCRREIHKWEVDDVPAAGHQQIFPHCPFVRGDDAGNVPLGEWIASLLDDEEMTMNSADALIALKSESVRLKTFRDWPNHKDIEPSEFTSAGLFYTGLNDYVQCAFCLGIIKGWHVDNVPSLEHQHLYPQCPFVRGDDVGNVSLANKEV